MKRSAVPLLASVVGVAILAGCSKGHKGGAHEQFIEFSSFTVKDGVYRPQPGWTFTRGDKDTIRVARQAGGGGGVIITPCECALETGGSCNQATIDGPNGDIREVFCVDQNCGFCIGGTVDPKDPDNNVRFSVVPRPDKARGR